VLSCDNVTRNGAITRNAVVAFAALRDKGLATWVAERGAFPDSMVDRITPGTTDADRAMVEATFGVRDRWPVMTEPFTQWVVEDEFCDGRPPLDEVGVQFVRDVRPYALAKTRLLNASHSALGYLGLLAGYGYLDEMMAEPAFSAYVGRLMDDEVAPLLPPVDIDLRSYTLRLRERFTNSAIADPLARLCRNGSAKLVNHLLPSIREARALGRSHAMLTLAVAAWCRYVRGFDERGRAIAVDDPRAAVLQPLALFGADDPTPLLAHEAIFGSLGSCAEFVAELRRDLQELDSHGVRAVVAQRALAYAGEVA
jgi:fructuronate reductase/mannitol 2-dehydrogenase